MIHLVFRLRSRFAAVIDSSAAFVAAGVRRPFPGPKRPQCEIRTMGAAAWSNSNSQPVGNWRGNATRYLCIATRWIPHPGVVHCRASCNCAHVSPPPVRRCAESPRESRRPCDRNRWNPGRARRPGIRALRYRCTKAVQRHTVHVRVPRVAPARAYSCRIRCCPPR
jgi:hypothetical protein